MSLWQIRRLFLLTVLIVLLFALIVPYNVDEFMIYQPLFCHYYPFSTLNTFAGQCHQYDLNVLGTGLILPLRSYDYVGSFPSLYYYPLFLLWRSPVSARWINALFLLTQAAILSRLFRVRIGTVFLGLCLFFPYFFQHIVDTGPVSFQILTIYLLFLLFRRWAAKPSWLSPLLITLLLFCGIWTKPIYFVLLPGIAALFGIALIEQRRALRRHWRTFVLQTFLGLALLGGLHYGGPGVKIVDCGSKNETRLADCGCGDTLTLFGEQ